jgi:hypothetical protein
MTPHMRQRILPLIAVSLLPVAAGTSASAAQLVATPRATLVPASITNRPFLAAASALAPIDLAAHGYAEDELLVSGQANTYSWAPAGARDAVIVQTPRLRYVTRVLVRRPLDSKRFSGRVIVELLDATEQHDAAPLWGLSHAQFLRGGDAWVGVTVSVAGAATLQKFDPVRYGSLALASPPTAACKGGNGFAWDVIAQVGALVRSTSRENPLRSYNPGRVVLAGYGQGGADIVTYINALHDLQRLSDGAAIYDGYLVAGVTATAPALNQCANVPPSPAGASAGTRRALAPRGSPVVVVVTQSGLQRAPELQLPDSDDRGSVFRRYEIAGAAQSGPFPAGLPAAVDLRIAGLQARAVDACRELASDFPMGYALSAIWQHFDKLLATGEAMPNVPRIEVDARGEPLPDAQGNALGGWRLPQIEVPLASYSGRSTGNDARSRAACEMTGSMRRLDVPRLKALYGDRSGYIERFASAVDRAVDEGWLVKEDADALKAPVVKTLPAF